MNSSTFIHSGKNPYVYKAEHEVREDGTEYDSLKIFDNDSEFVFFFKTKKDIANLIKELIIIL